MALDEGSAMALYWVSGEGERQSPPQELTRGPASPRTDINDCRSRTCRGSDAPSALWPPKPLSHQTAQVL